LRYPEPQRQRETSQSDAGHTNYQKERRTSECEILRFGQDDATKFNAHCHTTKIDPIPSRAQ